MRYRVAFSFLVSPGQVYYSEWFDTFSEALDFDAQADETAGINSRYIGDENDEII